MGHPLDQTTIGDLIDVPEVQTVIDLSEVRDFDPDDPEGRVALESLSHSFVVTEDILEILSAILGSIDRDEGRGFFIVGNYGSGKSHLLSVLGLLARYSWARPCVFNQHADLQKLRSAVDHHRLLPVMVPLTEYASEYSLEKIIWHAAETTAALAGVPLNLTYTQRFLDLFNRYILPVHEAEFREFLSRRFDDVTWEQICRDDIAAAHTLVLQFIERGDRAIPFDVTADRSEILTTLTGSIRQNGWDGIFLIIDELSEFLKAKPDNRTLNEDTRFLQFLGEASKTRPLWIAAALQENIERTGEISPAVLKKIKDRYHQRLRLSTRHLHTLISQRLIQKKHPNAESIIHAVFERLQRAFNRIPMNRETFQTIYPVHPETLELLNQNIDLFSQRRGIIDFLSVRIRGRGTDRIPGILDRPCDHLLTPDVIFDHFFDRLASAPQFSDYYMLFQQEFAPRVPRVFPDPAERDAAERTLKILILLAVSPFREERTVRELANMILYCALDPSIAAGETNYAFFEERIIRKLYENVGFLQRVAGKTRLEDVYKIGIMPGQTETLEDRLDRIKSGMEPDMREGLVDIVTAMGHGEFPLALFFNRTAIREAVLWQNTRRRIGIRMLHFSDLNSDDVSEMRDELRTGRLDMVLLLAFPGDSVTHQLEAQGFLSRESGETLSAWTFVIPESLEHAEMKNCLVELQACRILIRDLGTEQDSGSIEYLGMVKERRERFLETGRSLLVRAFQNAVLFTAEGRLEISGGKASEPFDRWLESVTGPALNRRFPDHHQIAPMADCTSRVLQQMILDRLVKPGRLTRKQAARDDALIGAVESVMIPLGLAQKKRDDYILTGTPKTSIAARFVMDYLPITESLDYAGGDTRIAAGRVWLSVHSSRFGMARPVFDLTLATLIRKGFVSAYLNDRQVSLDSLEMPLTGQIDRLSRGPLLPDHLKPAFRRLYKLLTHRELADWDMDLQEQLWKKTVAQIDLWIETAGEFQRCLEQIRARFPDSVLELRRTGQMLEQLQELKNALGEADSVVPNWHGFLPVFDASDSIEDWNRGLKHLKSFVSIGFAPYMAAKSYLSDPRLAFPDTSDFETIRKLSKEVFELSQISDERVLDSGLKPFLDKFDQFLKEYSKLYIAAHQRKNQSIRDQKYHDVLKSLEVQVFERLQSVPLIRRMCHNRRPLQTALNASRAICTLDPEPMLLSTPACRCGFVPGTTDDIPDARELLDRIRSQLGIAVDIIQSPEVHGKLMELAASADQTDLEASVNQLLTMDARDPDFVTRLDGILDTRMLRLLQKVDTARSPKAVLRLRQLTALLDGQVMSVDQARKKITEWLQTRSDLDENDWIRFEE